MAEQVLVACQNETQGRYVYIYIPNHYLTICEVEVFGSGKLYVSHFTNMD